MTGILIELQGISITHVLLLLVGIFALIPVVRLVRLYLKTKVPEYMLFGAVFFVSTMFTITSVLAELTNELIFWIISYSLRNLTYFLFFIHTIRMTWGKPSSLIAYIGVILFAMVQMLIFLWTPLEGMNGAGFVTNQNNVIYSTEKRLLGNIFQLYVAFLFFYGYMTVKLQKPTPRLKTSFRIMVGMSFLLMLSRVVRIVQNFGFPKNELSETFGEALLLLAFASVASLFYYYPGAIMISKVQLAGLIVISDIGTPLASFKFEGSELSGSSTLLAGIINALQ